MNDLETVRKHVQMLLDARHTYRTISQASGVPLGTIGNLVRPHRQEITSATAGMLLAVEVRPPWDTPGVTIPPRSLVPGTGTVRRLRALARMGLPIRIIGEGTGLHPTYLQTLINSPRSSVWRSTADSVALFYRRTLRNPPAGLNVRCRNWAERNGWAGPGLWDDIDRDECPAQDGDLAVLVEYVEENPGMTTGALKLGLQETGMSGTVANRLIDQALTTERISRIRARRTVRIYAS